VAAVILDTSVLIALFKGDDPHHSAAVQATSVRNEYLISVITLSEALIAAFRMSSRFGNEHRILISKVLQKIISVDEDIAVLGSQIRAEKNLSLPDALISATAQKFKAQLWSCDRELVKVHRGAVLIK
jgi:predicted nucleic acid-binding protein